MGERNGVRGLCIVASRDHAAIGVHAVAQRLAIELGAAVDDDEFSGIHALVEDALVAGRAVHVFEALVGGSADVNRFTVFSCVARFFICIVRKYCVLLAGQAHGFTFSVFNVI
ncbi:hypothetical protein [Xanthomonas theicola]|uniref:hypothetical protein n=1 Tax=Xanthomonas theicola TaxID=56464 RepID=UPI00201120E1|nr:hypothetical protein [Xanthomonas theicola]